MQFDFYLGLDKSDVLRILMTFSLKFTKCSKLKHHFYQNIKFIKIKKSATTRN